jgi:hypothetical protein
MMASGDLSGKRQGRITGVDLGRQAGGFGSLAAACIARQPHTVLQAKYAEMDDRALKAP